MVPINLFSMRFVSIHVVYPYSSNATATGWKKSHFILSDQLDFYMIDNLSITIHASARRILTSLSGDVILLSRYMTLFNFKCSSLEVNGSNSFKIHILGFIRVYTETNASCYLLQAMQQGFGLGRCICKKC